VPRATGAVAARIVEEKAEALTKRAEAIVDAEEQKDRAKRVRAKLAELSNESAN